LNSNYSISNSCFQNNGRSYAETEKRNEEAACLLRKVSIPLVRIPLSSFNGATFDIHSTTNLSQNEQADGIQNPETFSSVASVHFILLKI
jgi:hypothetical protein